MRIVTVKRERKGERPPLSTRFILNRKGNFDALHEFLGLLKTEGEASNHWVPPLFDWIALQVLFNRLRRFDVRLHKKYLLGFLQFIQENERTNCIVQPTWEQRPQSPLWVEKGSGRPRKHMDQAPGVTALDTQALAEFYSDAKTMGKSFPWSKWLNNESSVVRVVEMAYLCGDAFTETVNGVSIDDVFDCPKVEGTWTTDVHVKTARGLVALPVHNTIPRIDLRGQDRK